MNKLLLLLVLPLLAVGLTGCDDDEDVKPMDLNLLDGVWTVEDRGGQDVFAEGCILDISTSEDLTEGSYGGCQGSVMTYYLTVDGTTRHDTVYRWNILEMENHMPLLNLIWFGELDGEEYSKEVHSYKITKLTDTHMWWQPRDDGDSGMIKFRRRSDLLPD